VSIAARAGKKTITKESIMFKSCIQVIGCALLLAQAAFPAFADTWPSRPIKLVVPYPPGGSTDVTARVIADSLRPLLGQTVVIDNRPGAGGNIGAEAVAKSAPDGYTFLMATSTHVTNMSLYRNLPYDFVQDLAPVAQTAFIPNVLVVGTNLPVGNLAEFIAYVKSGRYPVNYGTAGNGSSQHLSSALFNSMVAGNMVHVPYKGGAPATADLLAGQIQAYFRPTGRGPASHQGRKGQSSRNHHEETLAAVARGADDSRGAARIRSGTVERRACAREDARRYPEQNERGDRQGAESTGGQGALRRAGLGAGRQFTGGVQAVHCGRGRKMEGAGQDFRRKDRVIRNINGGWQ